MVQNKLSRKRHKVRRGKDQREIKINVLIYIKVTSEISKILLNQILKKYSIINKPKGVFSLGTGEKSPIN